MKGQSGFISSQLDGGIAGSGTLLNYAVWQSVAHFRAALANPEFQARLAYYPDTATVSPHLFRKMEVETVCVALKTACAAASAKGAISVPSGTAAFHSGWTEAKNRRYGSASRA